jgi:hypothetical protein
LYFNSGKVLVILLKEMGKGIVAVIFVTLAAQQS